jgi:hypothetical protein
MKYLIALLLAALSAPTVEAFSSSQAFCKQVTQPTTALHSHVSRRFALQGFLAPALAVVTTSFAAPAFADVTNKVASQSSLRYLKRSMKELDKLEFYAAQNDYAEIKQGIRSPGLSEIRKNASVLIRGGEDGPEAENLQSTYTVFIKDIEQLDAEVNLGIRGSKKNVFPRYQKAVTSLAAFAEVAVKSVSIPMESTE